MEPVRIVQGIVFSGAIVIAVSLLVQIPEPMERFDAYVSSRDAALQERPEVFDSVGMDSTVNVLHGMVDNLVLIFSLQAFVSAQLIAVEIGASLHVLLHYWRYGVPVAIWHNLGANLSAALKESHDGALIVDQDSGDPALPFAQVHISRLATDVGFVHFDFGAGTSDLGEGLRLPWPDESDAA